MYKYISLLRKKIEACILYIFYILYCLFTIPIIYIYALFPISIKHAHISFFLFLSDIGKVFFSIKKITIYKDNLQKTDNAETKKNIIYVIYIKEWIDYVAIFTILSQDFILDKERSTYIETNPFIKKIIYEIHKLQINKTKCPYKPTVIIKNQTETINNIMYTQNLFKKVRSKNSSIYTLQTVHTTIQNKQHIILKALGAHNN